MLIELFAKFSGDTKASEFLAGKQESVSWAYNVIAEATKKSWTKQAKELRDQAALMDADATIPANRTMAGISFILTKKVAALTYKDYCALVEQLLIE